MMIDKYLEKLEEARNFIKTKKLEEAGIIFRELLDEELDELYQYEVSSEYGLLLYELGDYKSSVNFLVHAINLDFDDNDGLLHKILAFAYIKLNKKELAAEFLEESLFLNPVHDDQFHIAKFQLAKVLIDLEDYDLALSHLNSLSFYFKEKKHLEEYFHSSVYYLGQCHFIKKNFETAEEYFEDLIRFGTPNSKGHGYFGLVFIANINKNGEKMIEFAQKVVENIPDFYDKESIMYFTVLAYQYLEYKNEFQKSLGLFIKNYPEGKYRDKYDELESIFK